LSDVSVTIWAGWRLLSPKTGRLLPEAGIRGVTSLVDDHHFVRLQLLRRSDDDRRLPGRSGDSLQPASRALTRLVVDGTGHKVVSAAGGLLLTRTAMAVGLDAALSAALARWRRPFARRDRGKRLERRRRPR
jgi:hypothetical protein